jgi:4,5-dihydroxyphthalate decarboxylase
MVLATSPLSAPLKQRTIASPRVRTDFVEVTPIHKAFAPMVRSLTYDVCELAIVTCLQAIAYERPIVMLPVVVASRFQRGCLIAHRQRGVPAVTELAGKRIGVRSYTQTTGTWVRAHLTEDYGLATDSVRWLTHDPAHVEQYRDPPFVEHTDSDKSLPDMLRDGEIDAAILGNDLPKGDEFAPVISDAAARDMAWWRQHRFIPINHVVVVSHDAIQRHPQAVKAVYDLLKQAHDLNAASIRSPSPYLFGVTALHEPIRWIIEACMEQGLLPRRLGVDEVLGPAERILRELLE